MNSPIDLATLPRLSLEELRGVWSEHFGRSPPPVQKRLLIRELAWRLQERVRGGLDAETARLLRSAVRSARQSMQPTESTEQSRRSRQRPDSAKPGWRGRGRGRRIALDLPPGTRLVREWRGRTHEVTVVESRSSGMPVQTFRYRNQAFKTLTEVAHAITGIHWSGPRFFGLTTRSTGGLKSP